PLAHAAAVSQIHALSLHDALPIYEQHVHRTAVRCVELHRVGQADECAGGLLQTLDAAVGNGNALAEAGGAEAFAREQAVEHVTRSEEHTSELQSRENLVCRLLLDK